MTVSYTNCGSCITFILIGKNCYTLYIHHNYNTLSYIQSVYVIVIYNNITTHFSLQLLGLLLTVMIALSSSLSTYIMYVGHIDFLMDWTVERYFRTR